MEIVINNLDVIIPALIVVLSAIIKLIPTKKKWVNVFDIIIRILSAIPDRKKGGGVHSK